MESSRSIPPRIRPHTALGAGWLALGAAGIASAAVLLYRFNPEQHAIFPPCVFHLVTGWSCPGCGATRAAHQLLHGDLVQAFQLNPVAVLAVPVLGYLAVRYVVRVRTGRVWPWPRWRPAWGWAIGILVAGFSVARNLPWAAFDWFRL